jgi:hypothetical protein
MGDSKGGHPNLNRSSWDNKGGGDEGNFQPKVMIEFGDILVDAWDVRRVEKGERHDAKAEDGLVWFVLLRFKSPPFDKFIDFTDRKKREQAYSTFVGKLMVNGIKVI